MGDLHLKMPQEQIEAYCRKWKIKELSFFGSVLRKDFKPDSDVDVLVSFYPEARHTLFDHVDMQEELQNIFKRKVDLITRNAVEKSRNYIRRKAILESVEPYYVQE
jgi:predicted nucleotidyltransferase